MKSLELDNVRLNYGGLTILNNISFSVDRGEFIILFGPNGSGKTTLLKLIAGLLKPSSGTVLTKSERIGFVFQEDRLIPWKTVYENLEIVLRNYINSQIERNETINKYLTLLGLNNFKKYYPNKLSGGMRQKVSIARALMIDSDLLLMDEPFSALDINTRERLQQELLYTWKETRKTIVFVTHSIDESMYFEKRIIYLS